MNINKCFYLLLSIELETFTVYQTSMEQKTRNNNKYFESRAIQSDLVINIETDRTEKIGLKNFPTISVPNH